MLRNRFPKQQEAVITVTGDYAKLCCNKSLYGELFLTEETKKSHSYYCSQFIGLNGHQVAELYMRMDRKLFRSGKIDNVRLLGNFINYLTQEVQLF